MYRRAELNDRPPSAYLNTITSWRSEVLTKKEPKGVFSEVARSVLISNQFRSDLNAVYQFGMYLKSNGKNVNQEVIWESPSCVSSKSSWLVQNTCGLCTAFRFTTLIFNCECYEVGYFRSSVYWKVALQTNFSDFRDLGLGPVGLKTFISINALRCQLDAEISFHISCIILTIFIKEFSISCGKQLMIVEL